MQNKSPAETPYEQAPLASLSNMTLENVMQVVADEFDHHFYLVRYKDVADADVDPLQHYCTTGWQEGRDPNPDFSTNAYLDKFPALLAQGVCPLLHKVLNLEHRASDRVIQMEVPGADGGGHIVRLSAPSSKELNIVRPFFDAEYYADRYPDIAQMPIDPLVHYMTMGWMEMRDPSPKFSTRYYLHANNDIRRSGGNPFLHYCKNGRKEKWRTKTVVSPAAAQALMMFEEGGALHDKLLAAKDLEPMVAFPRVKPNYTCPIQHDRILAFTEDFRLKFQDQTYDHIVLVPHVRLSGAAHVAGHLVSALAQMYGADRVLLVQTDASHYEFSSWFPKDVARLDLSAALVGLPQDRKFKFLTDLLYGIEAKSIYNVQSKLFWDLLHSFGKQLSQEMQIISYLFCWDMTVDGDRTGYPVQALRDTVDFQHIVLTDSSFLQQELQERFGLGLPGAPKVQKLLTPVELRSQPAPPCQDGRPRALWAGRHDRQKRLDVLVEIAKANPDLDIWVYGKPVLDEKTLADYNPPANIIEKGVYDDFDEVLENGFDFFLYTSQWDGIPTGLLAAAAARLPLVAPNVGGLSEVIADGAGWLVEACDDVEGYSRAIHEILFDRSEASNRAARLYERLKDLFSHQKYAQDLEKVLKADG